MKRLLLKVTRLNVTDLLTLLMTHNPSLEYEEKLDVMGSFNPCNFIYAVRAIVWDTSW